MKDKVESIVKFIPIIYPIIIFLGYFNYYAFYRFFDIDIFQYLTISELLFSFISMIIPLLIILFLVLCYIVFAVLFPNTINQSDVIIDDENKFDESLLNEAEKRLRERNENKEVKFSLIFNNSHNNLPTYWKQFIRKKKQKKYSRATHHFFSFVFDLISLIIKIFLWLFFLAFSMAAFEILIDPLVNDINNFKPFFNSTKRIILFLILWSSIVYAIIYRGGKNLLKSVRHIIHSVPIIFIILFSITVYQKIRVEKIINHKEKEIKFSLNGEIIKSNSDFIYIGKTSDYIFLREMNAETNYIYQINQISKLEIKMNKEKVNDIEIKEEK